MRELITKKMSEHKEEWSDIEGIKIELEHHGDDASNFPIHHYSFGDVLEDEEEEISKVKLKDLTFDELLDKEFFYSYGSPCPINPMIWTENRVYYHHEYDGFDSIRSLPRHP